MLNLVQKYINKWKSNTYHEKIINNKTSDKSNKIVKRCAAPHPPFGFGSLELEGRKAGRKEGEDQPSNPQHAAQDSSSTIWILIILGSTPFRLSLSGLWSRVLHPSFPFPTFHWQAAVFSLSPPVSAPTNRGPFHHQPQRIPSLSLISYKQPNKLHKSLQVPL